MAYHESTVYLEKELMFKNEAENKYYTLGNCKLSLAGPRQVSLDVTESGQVQYNFIESVSVGQYDNMLCITSQNGVSFFLFEAREDRDEWYSTIKQLQHGHVPCFQKKHESLPACSPDTSPKTRDKKKMPASSPSTLQDIFKRELESKISPNLKQPQIKKGSGSYVNMDYNKALQDSKESYRMLNLLQGMQNVPGNPNRGRVPSATEDDTYDVPDDGSTDLIEEQVYEDLDDVGYDDPTEDRIYDDPCHEPAEDFHEEQFYDDTEIGAGAPPAALGGAWGGASNLVSGQATVAPPLPPRPNSFSSPQNFDEHDPVAPDLPPPLPARPRSLTQNSEPAKVAGATRTGKVAMDAPKKPPKSTPSESSPKTPGKPSEVGKGGLCRSRPSSTSDHGLADELALKLSQRARSLSLTGANGSVLPSSNSHERLQSNTVPRIPERPTAQKPVAKSSQIDKVQLRSPDKGTPQSRPTSVSLTDELAMKLAKRSSVLSASDSTDSTSDDLTRNGHRDSRGPVPSVGHKAEPMASTWKKQDHGNEQSGTQFPQKKKALVPPPTKAKPGKIQLPVQLNQDKKPKAPPPKPAKKPTQPSPPEEIYEDTEVGPPAPTPKPKVTKPGSVHRSVELDIRIPRHAMQSLAGSVIFSEKSDAVVIERTELPDFLHVGDRVLQIGDIDVRNSSAMFATECWKRVSENQVRVKILR